MPQDQKRSQQSSIEKAYDVNQLTVQGVSQGSPKKTSVGPIAVNDMINKIKYKKSDSSLSL